MNPPYDTLVPELRDDPLGRGYVDMDDASRLVSLQTRDRMHVVTKMIDEMMILGDYPGVSGNDIPAAVEADALLTKLEAVASANGLVARVLRWIQTPVSQGGGVDIGAEQTRTIAQSLVGAAGITQEEITALLSMAEEACDRLSELGLSAGSIGLGHMASAREMI